MNVIQRVAIITGGSRGMGRDTAMRLAHQGVSSIITYNTRKDEADKVVETVREAGAAAVALQLDLVRRLNLMGSSRRFEMHWRCSAPAALTISLTTRERHRQRRLKTEPKQNWTCSLQSTSRALSC